MSENELTIIENFLENKEEKLDVKDEPFDKLMFFYQSALKQLELQMNIIKEEFKIMYNYDLIDHIDTRIKEPKSIVKKMEKKKYKKTYYNLIEKINDIAGMRIVCTLKDDIFFIKDLVKQIPDIHILNEKDYVTNPKPSGYSSYHMIVEVPVKLSQKTIYVKCEIQIRTLAMDFWASFEHKVKYKTEQEVNKKTSKELVNCAKMISKFDDKMISLKNIQ
ncbi:relA/SpoT domain-containing protein [Clostridium sp. CAG:356]|nr:relA/SpoT domain-containing protein [Clostridium sp. CAG:356]